MHNIQDRKKTLWMEHADIFQASMPNNAFPHSCIFIFFCLNTSQTRREPIIEVFICLGQFMACLKNAIRLRYYLKASQKWKSVRVA